MKSEFKLLIVLYTSIHKNLIRREFMLDFPDYSSSFSYEFQYEFPIRRNLRARLYKLSILFCDFSCESIHTSRH